MNEKRGWGPFGLGKWQGHEGVFCRVCGWPVWSAYVGDGPPPGTCLEGKTSAIGCGETIDRLMLDYWVRRAIGGIEPSPEKEMLRATTGLSWEQIANKVEEKERLERLKFNAPA